MITKKERKNTCLQNGCEQLNTTSGVLSLQKK